MLKFVSKVRVSFGPWDLHSASARYIFHPTLFRSLFLFVNIREFLRRATAKKAVASNPKCEVTHSIEHNGLPPSVAFTYGIFIFHFQNFQSLKEFPVDGSEEILSDVSNMDIRDVISTIKAKSDALEYDALVKEAETNTDTDW